AGQANNPKFMTSAPEIAVEVNSPNDVMSEVLDKARWWLGQGTKQVWVIDDPTKTVTVYFPDGRARVYGEEDTLEAGHTLAGFSLPLKDLFQ
ncbi:MAG: Uma2 family endonuclease, partial [Myxococcota bacterium]